MIINQGLIKGKEVLLMCLSLGSDIHTDSQPSVTLVS